MTWFNFGNNETYHYFTWVTESGQIDVQKLLADAYTEVQTDTEHFADEDICIVARDVLAGLLQDRLEEISSNELGCDLGPFAGVGIGEVWNTDQSLWLPLARLALQQIDCHTVAEALLRQAGKWHPSKELPEVK
jgi:hypothetical protein